MKKLMFCTFAILLMACNQKQETKENNVMMNAMDDSMNKMHHQQLSGNPDYDFAAMMLPHHEGAIVMAEALLKSDRSAELKDFAKKVIEAQSSEIKMLKAYLDTASQQPSANAEKFKQEFGETMMPMMKGMQSAKLNNNIDHDFVVLMIPHHQSAVEMAKVYLRYANNALLKNLAMDIVKTQEKEIEELKSFK